MQHFFWFFRVFLSSVLLRIPSVSCAEINVFQHINDLVPVFSWPGLFLASLADYLWIPAVLSPWCTFGPLVVGTIKLVFNQFKSGFLAAASFSAWLGAVRLHFQRDIFPVGVRKAFKTRSRRINLLTSIIKSKESEYESLLARCTTSFALVTFGQQVINQDLSLDSTRSERHCLVCLALFLLKLYCLFFGFLGYHL